MTEPQVPQSHLLAVLSLTSDHLMGQHPEWGLRSCLLALTLAERLGAPATDDVRAAALLRFVGCTSDAGALAGVFSDDIAFRTTAATFDFGKPQDALSLLVRSAGQGEPFGTRIAAVLRVLAAGQSLPRENFRMSCEVADQLTARLGQPDTVRTALAHSFERWDGKGFPAGLRGDHVSLPARLALIATDTIGLVHATGRDTAHDLVRRRSGGAHDPALSTALLADWDELLDEAERGSAWDRVTSAQGPTYRGPSLDDALTVLADFSDLKSAYLAGHSRGVAELAAAAGESIGCDARMLRHAGLVHDLGRATVSTGTWDRAGPLDDVQWEEVRLHTYRTERVLAKAGYLRELGTIAGTHHERLDGSGYHRGSEALALSPEARVLAVADIYQALVSLRPHRPARTPADAATELRTIPGLDPPAVDAVLEAAGHVVRRRGRDLPAGLSEREAEVLTLLARGLTTKQVAQQLVISPKTADHHVQHVYAKVGVSTRGAATLWAVQHGLVG